MTSLLMSACGLMSIYLSQVSMHSRAARWAPLIGLYGQPAWFYYAGSNGDYELFPLCIAYTVIYVRGVYRHWRSA